nr:MAG TPA: hypothetical protein [Caudoviricetes sp.]
METGLSRTLITMKRQKSLRRWLRVCAVPRMLLKPPTTNNVKRVLRHWGMRECYTPGGCNIVYCGYTAFRLINDYCMEVWNPFETQSGAINYYESLEQRNLALYEMGLESMGVI